MTTNRIEVKAGNPDELSKKIKSLLESRPPNTNLLVLHTNPDDVDDLMAAMKLVGADFLDEKVLPLIFVCPDKDTESEVMRTVSLAFRFACERLAGDKPVEVVMKHLITMALISENISPLDIFKEMGLN